MYNAMGEILTGKGKRQAGESWTGCLKEKVGKVGES
jgi:hypothetical protein